MRRRIPGPALTARRSRAYLQSGSLGAGPRAGQEGGWPAWTRGITVSHAGPGPCSCGRWSCSRLPPRPTTGARSRLPSCAADRGGAAGARARAEPAASRRAPAPAGRGAARRAAAAAEGPAGRRCPPPRRRSPLRPPAPPGRGPRSPRPGGDGDGARRTPRIVRIEFVGNALFSTSSLKVHAAPEGGRGLSTPSSSTSDMETLFRFFESVTRAGGAGRRAGSCSGSSCPENPLVVELRGVRRLRDPGGRRSAGCSARRSATRSSPTRSPPTRRTSCRPTRTRASPSRTSPSPWSSRCRAAGAASTSTWSRGRRSRWRSIVFRGNVHLARKDLLDVDADRGGARLRLPHGASVPRGRAARGPRRDSTRSTARRATSTPRWCSTTCASPTTRSSVVITIAIVEHLPYCVGTVHVDIKRTPPEECGALPPEDVAYFTEARLIRMARARPGDARTPARARTTGREADPGGVLPALLHRRAWSRRRAAPARARAGRRRVPTMDSSIKEGRKTRLRRLDFVGNEFTRDKFLRRETRGRARRLRGPQRARPDHARLRNARLLRPRDLRIDDAGARRQGRPVGGWKDATYEIVEGKTGKLNFGVEPLDRRRPRRRASRFTKRNFDIARPPRSSAELGRRRVFTGAARRSASASRRAPSHRVRHRVRRAAPLRHGLGVLRVGLQKRVRASTTSTSSTASATRSRLGAPDPTGATTTRSRRRGRRWRHEDRGDPDVDDDAVPGAFLFAGRERGARPRAPTRRSAPRTTCEPTLGPQRLRSAETSAAPSAATSTS